MRKWYMVACCLIIAVGILLMLGCEGNAGGPGIPGQFGLVGDSGIDLTKLQPEDRPIAAGLTNNTFDGVEGIKSLWLTFDQAARGRPDTLAAVKVSVPPIIDGIDGAEAEWGPNQTRARLAFLNSGPGHRDPQIYDLVLRAAYDDENFYLFAAWKETKITGRTPDDRDTTFVDATASTFPRELYFDNSEKILESIDTVAIDGDTTINTNYFKWVRIDTTLFEQTCIPDLTTPDPNDSICFTTRLETDTTLTWRSYSQGEDRLAMFFSGMDTPPSNWGDLALTEFFDLPAGANFPAGYNVDVWSWGSGTTSPVYVADDWMISSSGKRPDAGDPPFVNNYILPDSVPKYMFYRDPNYKTELNLETVLFPFWYYDAVGYSRRDWQLNRGVFVAGYITTIPSQSRADVYAASVFESATGWIVEMKRARRTSNGDDVVF